MTARPRAQIKDGQVIATIKDKFGEDRRVVQRGSRIRIALNDLTPVLKMNRGVSKLLGDRIKNARKAAGLNLEQCAIRAGMTSGWPKNRMYEIETAARGQGMRLGTLYAIAAALSVEVTDLMPSVAEVLELSGVEVGTPRVIALSSAGQVVRDEAVNAPCEALNT